MFEDYGELWRSSGESFPSAVMYTLGDPVEDSGPGRKSVVVLGGGSGMSVTSNRAGVKMTLRAILGKLSVAFAAGSRSVHTYIRSGNNAF